MLPDQARRPLRAAPQCPGGRAPPDEARRACRGVGPGVWGLGLGHSCQPRFSALVWRPAPVESVGRHFLARIEWYRRCSCGPVGFRPRPSSRRNPLAQRRGHATRAACAARLRQSPGDAVLLAMSGLHAAGTRGQSRTEARALVRARCWRMLQETPVSTNASETNVLA